MSTLHVTRDGRTIPITDMEDSHLLNTLLRLERRAKEGILVQCGGGVEAEDIWYDEDVVYGEEALSRTNYFEYRAEARRRGLIK